MLIAFSSYSQGTIQITEQQAKEAIKAKQKVKTLGSAIQAQGLVISEFKLQVSDLKLQNSTQAQQLGLWEENYNLLNTQYEAEKAKKPKDKTVVWILRCVGAFGVGYFVGNVL